MFDCCINLCAFVYSLENSGQPYVVSEEERQYAPLKYKISNEDRSIKDCVYNLIDDCINKSPQNINTFLMDVILQENQVNIYYVCLLPLDSKIFKGYKIPMKSFMHIPLLTKALKYV